ncbi:hypothetical protein RFF05_12905 [Bengtsoniella intestinalis]|uniref:hypothetical protein n=1 Tax=Bengtsoniella intestinalis TaxID=3073143 RepID=UPI00391FB614
MLTKPLHGWTDFQLEGTSTHALSFLDDIAYEWLDHAIHGLETLSPFCVKGYLEPDRFLCTVSFCNCHIIIEDDERDPLTEEDILSEYSHTSMIAFCKYLHQDISQYFEEWVSFADWRHNAEIDKRDELTLKLKKLEDLIAEKEYFWDENRCFL